MLLVIIIAAAAADGVAYCFHGSFGRMNCTRIDMLFELARVLPVIANLGIQSPSLFKIQIRPMLSRREKERMVPEFREYHWNYNINNIILEWSLMNIFTTNRIFQPINNLF